MQHQNLGAGEKRRIDLEGGVFGGRADQDDRAVLDIGQEGILLGAVEAVNLVDEQERPLAMLAAAAGGFEGLAQLRHAGEHRRNLLEMEPDSIRQEPRNSCLAGAGRAPEDERHEPLLVHKPAQHAVRSQEMILADDLFEGLGAQPVGQWPRRGLVQSRSLKECRHMITV